MTQHFEFRVPATTANLGPGFGVVGLALDLWFDVSVTVEGDVFSVDRPDAPGDKTLDERHDPIVRGIRAAAERFDVRLPEGMTVVVRGDAPRRCGLGSNTAEYCAGIQIASRLAKTPPTQDAQLGLLIDIGGDPAHGAASLRGGLAFAVPVQQHAGATSYRCLGAPISNVWWVTVTAPDVQLATSDTHRVVPATVPNAVVQRSAGRLVGLLHALAVGDPELLGPCLVDEVHVPFRMALARGMARAVDAGREAGAAGVTISGHGPALLAFTTDAEAAREVSEAMRAAFDAADVANRSLIVHPVQAF